MACSINVTRISEDAIFKTIYPLTGVSRGVNLVFLGMFALSMTFAILKCAGVSNRKLGVFVHQRICSLAVFLAVLPLASVGADTVANEICVCALPVFLIVDPLTRVSVCFHAVYTVFLCAYTVALAVLPRTGIGKFPSIISVCAGALAVW